MAERVSAGQPLRSRSDPLRNARVVNDILACKDDYLRRRAMGQDGAPGDRYVNPCVVKIKNMSGDALVRGDVLQVGDSLLTTLDPYSLWFEADYRAAGSAFCGILLDAVPDDKFGRLQVAGVCLATVNCTNGGTHAYAVTGGTLQSNFSGPFRIVWPVGSDAGPTLCLVEVNCFQPRRKVVLDGELVADGSVSGSVYINDVDVGSQTIWFNWMTAGVASIPAGTEGIAEWYDDEQKWVFVAAGCSA